MTAFWSWAAVAAVLPIAGGGYLGWTGARPDVAVAFVAAGSAGRAPAARLLLAALFLCAVRYALVPPDARGESIGLGAVAILVVLVAAVSPMRGRIHFLASLAGGYGGLLAFTAAWQKAAGSAVALPPLSVLTLSFTMTVVVSAAFLRLLGGTRRGE